MVYINLIILQTIQNRKTLFLLFLIMSFHTLIGQCVQVITHAKISDTRGYFNATINTDDHFGSPSSIGDIDGDGIGDLAVGAKFDDDGGTNRGAIYIIFLDIYGRCKAYQKISDTQGGFNGTLDNYDEFGGSIDFIGDLNGDNKPEIMVSAQNDDDGGTDRGAIWILSLNSNGTVASYKKISDTQGGFSGILDNGDKFGNSIGTIGDLNNDNVIDIAVGANEDDDGGTNRGAIYILFLDTSATVINEQKISDTAGNFYGILDDNDNFGTPNGIGDLNGDGIVDVAVGAASDDDGGLNRGAVWILFLDSLGKVKNYQKISDVAGGFSGTLDNSDWFGGSVESIKDLNNDNIPELLVSAVGDDDGGTNRGAFWILFMNANGTVSSDLKISDIEGNFQGLLNNDDSFSELVSFLGDFNNDGLLDIAVSSALDDDGGSNKGAVWILSLDGCYSGCNAGYQKRFEKSYMLSGNNYGHSIINTVDGGFAICGLTNVYGAGSNDFFILKINSEGDTLWSRTYGGSGNDFGQSINLKQMSDKGYIMAGRSSSFSSNGGALLVRTKLNGDLLWSKLVDSISNENARDIELTEDGGFIVSGTNGFIMKYDSLGIIQWNKYFSGGGNMHMTSVIVVPNKFEYLVVGNSSSYGMGGRSGYLIYLDSAGNKLWERYYDNTSEESFITGLRAEDGGFIIGGYNSNSAGKHMLTKIDSSGKFVWCRNYYQNSGTSRVVHITKGHNRGYVISSIQSNASNYNNLVFKIDDYGNVEWSKIFKGNSNTDNQSWFAESLVNTVDGGYALLSYGIGLNGTSATGIDPYLVKINNCGEAACTHIDVNLVGEEFELYHNDPSSTIVSWASPVSVTLEVDTINFISDLICETNPVCQLTANFSIDTICFGDSTRFTDLSYDSLANVTGW